MFTKTQSVCYDNCNVGATGNNNVINGNISITSRTNDRYLYEFSVTPASGTFEGRGNDIKLLEEVFFKQNKRKIVVCGLPGYGKSELARQFAKICEMDNTQTFWIPCKSIHNLKKDLLLMAYKECKTKRCLFIFDGSLNRKSICKYEPPENDKHFLLVTSHQQDWGKDMEKLILNELSLASAIDVIKSILNKYYDQNNDDIYEELAEFVYRVPLGLQIVAGRVRKAIEAFELLEEDFHLEIYADTFIKTPNILKETIAENMCNSYQNSIYGAMKVLLDKLNEEIENFVLRKVSMSLLYICSYLNSENIYFEELFLLPNIQGMVQEFIYQQTKLVITCPKKMVLYNKMVKTLSLNVLVNNLLLTFSSKDKPLIIQGLTQKFLRYHLKEYEINLQEQIYTSCLQYVFEERKGVQNNIYHIQSVLNYADENATVVTEFYNDVQNEAITEYIFESLLKNGCIQCLKEIVNSFDITFNYDNLLPLAEKYNQEEILQLLQNVGVKRLKISN